MAADQQDPGGPQRRQDEVMTISRWVVQGTCIDHPHAGSYTNVAVSRDGDEVFWDPHAICTCRVMFTLNKARELHAALGELL